MSEKQRDENAAQLFWRYETVRLRSSSAHWTVRNFASRFCQIIDQIRANWPLKGEALELYLGHGADHALTPYRSKTADPYIEGNCAAWQRNKKIQNVQNFRFKIFPLRRLLLRTTTVSCVRLYWHASSSDWALTIVLKMPFIPPIRVILVAH